MAQTMKERFLKLTAMMVALVLLLSAMPFGAAAAPWDGGNQNTGRGNWSYAYYLGQEYLGNAGGSSLKPDPVGYGFQGVITELTFEDDAGKSWTFVWSAEANGEWRITGEGVSEDVAKAWPQVTNGRRYVGYCGNKVYTFTLSQEGSAEEWTYARNNHANWFYYIRFIREYTVNVFYQNETGTVTYNGVTYAAQSPLVREFHFLYPNGNIIDDSEYEDGEYTDPVTLRPADYLTQDLIDQGYELKYATDSAGNDVLETGVTISLLGTNVLNVYCTLVPPKTENYRVTHIYYTNGELDGSQDGGSIEVVRGADFDSVVAGIEKRTEFSENSYEYTSYQVDPNGKSIRLIYVRAEEPAPAPVDVTVTKVWVDLTPDVEHEAVQVQLYGNAEAVGAPATLGEDNGWVFTWENLDPEVVWTVAEVNVPDGYTSAVTGEGTVFTVTNTQNEPAPAPVDLTVTKAWANDTPSLRPESVLVQLYRDGVAYGEPVELNDANGWSNVWNGLDGSADWTADELYVPRGYFKTVEVVDGVVVITNTHTDNRLGDAYAAVTKIWDDNDYPDRPASVTVQLLCEGEPYGEPVELNAENHWHYTWYQLNPDLTWTLEEIDVPEGYTATVEQDGMYFVVNNYMDYEPPVDPVEPPTDPVEPPTDPVEPPTDPVEPPTDPVEPPTDPVEPPTDPSEPPTDPVEPPTDPSEPPTETTDPAATPAVAEVPKTGDALSGWIMVSVISGIGLAGTVATRKRDE